MHYGFGCGEVLGFERAKGAARTDVGDLDAEGGDRCCNWDDHRTLFLVVFVYVAESIKCIHTSFCATVYYDCDNQRNHQVGETVRKRGEVILVFVVSNVVSRES